MRRIGPFLVLFCCIAFATITEDTLAQYHSVDKEAKDAGKVTCALSPEGNATIRLRRDNYLKSETVRLFLSPFSSANKQVAVVGFAGFEGANQAPALEKQEEFKDNDQFPRIDIKARSWDPGASYNGTLTLVAAEGNASAVGVTLIGYNPFTLFATDAQNLPEIKRTLPGNGRVTVELRREPAQRPEKVRLKLSAFRSDGNPNAVVGFPSPEGSGKEPVPEQEKTIPAGETLMPIEIEARSWAAGVKYSGILTLVPEVGKPLHYQVTLQGPDPRWCTLVAEPKAAAINHTLLWGPFSRRGETGRFIVTLRDQTGKTPVDGLLVRLEGQPSSPLGIPDSKDNIGFRLKNREVPFLTTRLPLDAADADRQLRSILPGDQSDLEVIVKDLPAGEHQFKIRVSAANSEPDKSPEITLTVKVKHGWPLAVAILILAGIVSFLTTKGVDNQRKRVELDHRIRALRKDWLASLPALEPIAWLFAAQAQSSDLLKQAHFKLIPSFQEISNQLDKAERLLELARIYHELRVALPASRLDRLERYRFLKELDGIFRSIDPELLEEKSAKEIKQRLEATRPMLANPVSSDRQAVCAKAAWLQGEVVPEKLATGNDLGQLNHLMEEVFKKPGDSPSEGEIKAMDRLCAALQILWFWRNDAEQLNQLRPLVIQGTTDDIKLDKLLDKSDKMTWGKVQKQGENGGIRIGLGGQATPPKSAPSLAPGTPSQTDVQTIPAYCLEPVRALEPLTFLLWFDDAHVATSFPVNARIKCHWTFVLKRNGNTQRWSAHSDGRRIVQSVPTTGTLEIDVTMSFMGDEVRLPAAQVEVGKTEQLKWMKAFALSEFIATATATLVALLSGLNVEPFNKLTFGSLNDYLQLFLWGAAVDQGKNLFKTGQTSSGTERGTAQK